jgi:hypothetical protein
MSLQVKTCLSIGGLGFDICKPGQANCVKLLPTDCDPGNFTPGGGGPGGSDDGGDGGDGGVSPQFFNIQDLQELLNDMKPTIDD